MSVWAIRNNNTAPDPPAKISGAIAGFEDICLAIGTTARPPCRSSFQVRRFATEEDAVAWTNDPGFKRGTSNDDAVAVERQIEKMRRDGCDHMVHVARLGTPDFETLLLPDALERIYEQPPDEKELVIVSAHTDAPMSLVEMDLQGVIGAP